MRFIISIAFLVACAIAQTTPPTCGCSGNILTYPTGSEPACDASTRGTVIISLGGKGQPDQFKACIRDGLGRYMWALSGQQNPNSFVNSPIVGGCPVFPDNNVWNSKADTLQVDPGSKAIIATYGSAKLGTAPSMYLNLADASTPASQVSFTYSDQSDLGLYPVTGNMSVEGYPALSISGGPYSGDAHLLVLRQDQCKLYEIYSLASSVPPYQAGSGAIFDLLSNNLRPAGWTSTDAAGLPVWPGVLTYAELYGDGEIRHMLRFTVGTTRNTYVWPARHKASTNGSAAYPPMGSRWRLKAGFDETTCQENDNTGQNYTPEIQRLIRGLKHYGMILADNGLAIRITADADPRWGDPNSSSSPTWIVNGWMHCITGSDFEVVDASPLMVSPDSAAVVQ